MSSAFLFEQAVNRNEGRELSTGVIDVDTRPYTGRSPKDSFVVDGIDGVDYGEVNQPMDKDRFDALFTQANDHLERSDRVYVQDRSVGADSQYNIPVILKTERAAAALFANTMFLPRFEGEGSSSALPYTILHVPSMQLRGREDGVRSNVGVVTSFEDRKMLVAGTPYLGEIKKRMFGAMNYELPLQGVATMHCSANIGDEGDVALFFGLSGTGKTTLSMDPERLLIGDDEHGWSENGVFNFENGSYAKLIKLSEESEPGIYRASRQKGGISENGTFDLYLNPVYSQGEENMRGAFTLSQLDNVKADGMGGHPENIIFLTADASGVIPPVAMLTPEQAGYYFLSGYTSKVAGTERGVTKPESTFSACFGSPFLPLPPEKYMELLLEKISRHNPNVWMVNTGWPGGVNNNERMSIEHTRSIVDAVLRGEVEGAARDSLGFVVPEHIKNVPQEALRAENYWDNIEDYRNEALKLASDFAANAQVYSGKVDYSILNAGPQFTQKA
jgi:phosphoenolpyruvate carboxykinase (ATP)